MLICCSRDAESNTSAHITTSSGSRDSIYSLNLLEEYIFSKHALKHCSWLMRLKDNLFKGLAYFSQSTLWSMKFLKKKKAQTVSVQLSLNSNDEISSKSPNKWWIQVYIDLQDDHVTYHICCRPVNENRKQLQLRKWVISKTLSPNSLMTENVWEA